MAEAGAGVQGHGLQGWTGSFYVRAVTGSSICTDLPVHGAGTRSQRVRRARRVSGPLARSVGLTSRTYAPIG